MLASRMIPAAALFSCRLGVRLGRLCAAKLLLLQVLLVLLLGRGAVGIIGCIGRGVAVIGRLRRVVAIADGHQRLLPWRLLCSCHIAIPVGCATSHTQIYSDLSIVGQCIIEVVKNCKTLNIGS